jgi:rhomboid family GlyGly-CTERM serine protease
MKQQNVPHLTFALVAIAWVVHFLPLDPALVYYGSAEIASGENWRFVTGHLVHADGDHLLWNSLGLLVLGVLVERRSRRLMALSLLAGVIAIDGLLLASGLDYYCGLSGLLNALLVAALWLEWRATRSAWVVAVAASCLLKVVVEIALGDSLFTRISWPPYAWSHLAGMVAGVSAVWLEIRATGRRTANRVVRMAGPQTRT